MKVRNYEKMTLITSLLIIIFLTEMIWIINLNQVRIKDYKKFPMLMNSNKEGNIIVNKEERKLIYKNRFLYYQDNKIKYTIIEDQKLDNLKDYQIKLKLEKKQKENEVITVTIENKKISMIDMMRNTWGGDKNS